MFCLILFSFVCFFKTIKLISPIPSPSSPHNRYVEMYGEDQVFPIFRTNVGNLALSSVQFDPMVYQTYATLGAEIFLRTATLFSMADVKYQVFFIFIFFHFTSLFISLFFIQTEYNNVYSAMANIPFPGMPGGGHSVVMDPDGDTLAIIDSSDEEGIATAVIPLKEFRETTQTWPVLIFLFFFGSFKGDSFFVTDWKKYSLNFS